jgi:uncharacterized repeat protein (TIGR01451 family)
MWMLLPGAAFAQSGPTATQAIASTTLMVNQSATAFTPVIGSGGTGSLIYSISPPLPSGVIMSPSTGAISGTPTVASVATTYTVTVTDANGATAAETFSLTVNGGPVTLSPTTLPPATAGAPYSQTITTTGGTGSYTFAIIDGALPVGMTFNSSTGALQGTPTTAGSVSFTVRATDSGGSAGSQAYTLSVTPPTLTLSPPSGTSLSATIGTAFSQTFTPSGGNAPYTYSLAVVSGTFPTGLNMSGGVLSGTPTSAGTVTFTFSATDSTNGNGSPFTVSGTYTLTVTAATPTLAVTMSAAPAVATPGNNVTYGIIASVGGGTVTGLSLYDNLPPGLTFVSVTQPGGWTCTTPAVGISGNVICTTASAAPGNYNLLLVAKVAAGVSGSLTNAVTATATNATSASNSVAISVNFVSTTISLSSSANPSAPGQSVTFTARVASGGGTPTGTVTFGDGASAIGTGALAAGVATFTTASLSKGAHSITAIYAGATGFAASASSALTQTVAIPADSIKLREMQVAATQVVAQNSGEAIAGAIDDAIEEGFNDGGALITPSGSGVRFNFAADPAQPPATDKPRKDSRVDDAFAAMASSAMPTKAPPETARAPKDWLLWADVRGSGIDRWSSSPGSAQAQLYGWQVNTLVGLTHKVTPSFLVGVVGGYETFDYTSDQLDGRLKGEGWTIGSYLGWKLTSSIRFDLALAYSGIGYDGSAGTAQGNFDGNRWMLSSGFTGDYKAYGFTVEPSAKVYALWEHENAYTDSLGTRQDDRDFSTGRASGGVKLIYPYAWSDSLGLAPYVGLYGDYYFTEDDAAAIGATDTLASTPLLDGWSARMTGGVSAKLSGGSTIGLGAELGGIGSDVEIWTFRAQGSVPF